VKLTEVIDLFLRSKSAEGLSEKTLEWYQANLGAFVRFLERAGVSGTNWVQTGTVEAFLVSERERVSASTVAARFRSLRPFFVWLEGNPDFAIPSPMRRMKPPKVASHLPRQADGAAVDRLLSSIPEGTWIDLRDRLIITILDCCGLRAAEVCGLALGDFDLGAGVLLVRAGKGGDDRPVPFLPDVARALLAFLLLHPGAPGRVLMVSADGSSLGTDGALTVSGLRQMLERRCAAAGLAYLNPHSFRHGLAMRLLNRGADMSLVQAILGHSRIATTQQFYARWLISGLKMQYTEVMNRGR
jgi:site-specific recombinase XerD